MKHSSRASTTSSVGTSCSHTIPHTDTALCRAVRRWWWLRRRWWLRRWRLRDSSRDSNLSPPLDCGTRSRADSAGALRANLNFNPVPGASDAPATRQLKSVKCDVVNTGRVVCSSHSDSRESESIEIKLLMQRRCVHSLCCGQWSVYPAAAAERAAMAAAASRLQQ